MIVDAGGKAFGSRTRDLLRGVQNPLVPCLNRRLERLQVRVCVVYPEFLLHKPSPFAQMDWINIQIMV